MNIREALKDHVFDVDGEEFQVALSPRAQNAVLTLCILSAVMVAVGSILPSFEIEVTGLVGIAENFYHGSGSNVKVYVVLLLFERISHTLNAHTHSRTSTGTPCGQSRLWCSNRHNTAIILRKHSVWDSWV